MTYDPTNIFSYDIDEEKKVMKAKLVQTNLRLISQETNVLADSIMKNKELLRMVADRISQDEVSFRHNFLSQW